MRFPLPLRHLALAVQLTVAASAAAQSPLVVSPDILYYGEESETTIANESASPVVLDSVVVGFGGARAYDVEVVIGETTYGPAYLNPSMETVLALDAALGVGESALFRIVGYDPCIACRARAGEFTGDTLFVYAGGAVVADTAFIDLSRSVSAESGPESSALRLSLAPNPVAGLVRLSLNRPLLHPAEIVVVDAQGRVVSRQRASPGAASVRLSTAGLASGVYVVRAVTEASTASATLTVAR